MKELRLSLKTKWFEMTKAGIKTEDYREITPYWCSRLLGDVYGQYNADFWKRYNPNSVLHSVKDGDYSFINIGINVMTLGYPSNEQKDRILRLEHKGIEIRTGNPEWGAEPNKLYFVIKHGKIL